MTYVNMFDMFEAWQKQAAKLDAGEITKEEYDQWRYTYPKMESAEFKKGVDALRTKKKAEAAKNND